MINNDAATRYLQAKVEQMDTDEENFTNAMRREPVANKLQKPPREKNQPAQSSVSVRKTTTQDESNKAAESLAFINGPITIEYQEG